MTWSWGVRVLSFLEVSCGLAKPEAGGIPYRQLDRVGPFGPGIRRECVGAFESDVGQILPVDRKGHAGGRTPDMVDPAEGMAAVDLEKGAGKGDPATVSALVAAAFPLFRRLPDIVGSE